ncbi:hypothetical protein [Pseudoxanthomonas sp. PXM01]|uniref:hypothetical protein n=1 Tax=Pseudoxanthomonas sp. PXM01 TaxID=2769295 RepID=UPI00177C28D0|nr:hypothetical protein [Pseudoxanthomonas sp. PXM01]MBD9470401.1 hypothetical protein [Pseudoxanthomonas sp. PXM01]
MSTVYVPINCEFHDVLEATAVRRRPAIFSLRDPAGQPATVHARIVDLYAHDGMEYMRLDDGRVVRLDHIISVDGVAQASFTDACALPAH